MPKKDPNTDRMATLEDVQSIPQMTPPTRGFGHVPDLPDDRDFKARALFGARKGVPPEASLENCVSIIVDQENTSSCVGQAIGGAVDTRLRRLGRWDAPLVSRQAIYTFARALDRGTKTEPLADVGSMARLAMKGMKTWGVPTAHRWPFDPSKINDDLPWDVMQEASAYTLEAWWRIDSGGKERIEDICQALAAGYPVVFAVDVDTAFLDHKGAKPFGALDPTKSVGGHMLYAVGYKTVNGERLIRCVNSWGTGWGDAGFFWVREVFFARAMDLYVIQIG